MKELLRGEFERVASRTAREVWLKAVRERKEAAGTRVDAATILQALSSDRK